MFRGDGYRRQCGWGPPIPFSDKLHTPVPPRAARDECAVVPRCSSVSSPPPISFLSLRGPPNPISWRGTHPCGDPPPPGAPSPWGGVGRACREPHPSWVGGIPPAPPPHGGIPPLMGGIHPVGGIPVSWGIYPAVCISRDSISPPDD